MRYNLDHPAERAQCIEHEGKERYEQMMEEWRDRQVVETRSGHKIRKIQSRYGLLYAVGDLGQAFGTLDLARGCADRNKI